MLLTPDEMKACEKCGGRITNKVEGLSYYEEGDDKGNEERRLEVRNIMPASGSAPVTLAAVLLPGEHRDIRVDVQDLLTNANEWLETPNTNYNGRRPMDLIGTPDEQMLRDALRSAIYSGMA